MHNLSKAYPKEKGSKYSYLARPPKKRDKSRFEFHFIHFFFLREHLQNFTIQCCYLLYPCPPPPHIERVSCKVIATCGSQQAPMHETSSNV